MSNVGAGTVGNQEAGASEAALDARAEGLLARPPPGSHIVQLYQQRAFLAAAAVEYAAAGLRAGECVIVMTTMSRWGELRRRLESGGVNVLHAVEEGALRYVSAAQILLRWTEGRGKEAAAFEGAIGRVVRMARIQHATVRIYSELAEILSRRNQGDAALLLEQCWQAFIENQPLSVLCSCEMDSADRDAYNGRLRSLCRVHTHMLPGHDRAWLDATVNAAMAEVMEPAHIRMAQCLARVHEPAVGLPEGQALLLWLSENMPRTADHVISIVRQRRVAVIPP